MNALKRRGLRKEGGDKIGELRKGGFIRISAAGEAGKGLRGAYPQQGVYVVRLQDDDGKAFGRAGGRDYPQGIDQRAEKKNGRRDWRPKERGKVFAGASVFSKKKQVEAILRRDGLQGNRQRKKLLSLLRKKALSTDYSSHS